MIYIKSLLALCLVQSKCSLNTIIISDGMNSCVPCRRHRWYPVLYFLGLPECRQLLEMLIKLPSYALFSVWGPPLARGSLFCCREGQLEVCAGLTLLNAACKHLGIKVPASLAPGLRSLGCVPHSFSEDASRIGSQLPMVVTCSLMQILLAFLPSLSQFLHFFACASWDHLT